MKQRIFMVYPEQGTCPIDPVPRINLLNMDAQDAQDHQDPTLLHERLAPAMTASGFVDVQDCKPTVSRKNPVHPVHPCE
ncbi:MAG: hypothetical protein OXU26_11475 [Acidobacteriota bacterium]|nr:hypothetical protein [Acidobacteriota bacterium]